MHIVRRRGWEIAEPEVTPEHAVLNWPTVLAVTATPRTIDGWPERTLIIPGPMLKG